MWVCVGVWVCGCVWVWVWLWVWVWVWEWVWVCVWVWVWVWVRVRLCVWVHVSPYLKSATSTEGARPAMCIMTRASERGGDSLKYTPSSQDTSRIYLSEESGKLTATAAYGDAF